MPSLARPYVEHFSFAAGRRRVEQERRQAVRVLGQCGTMFIPGKPAPIPILHIDCRRRPDVADLVRLHATEGSGDITTSIDTLLAGRDSLVLIRCAFTSPARCRFTIALHLHKHRAWLETITAAGMVGLAPDGDPVLAVIIGLPSEASHAAD